MHFHGKPVIILFLLLPASMTLQASEPVLPFADLPIMEVRAVPFAVFNGYVQRFNSSIDQAYLKAVYLNYARECALEGVSFLVALSQLLLETNFLRFTGSVRPGQNNFAGLGAVNEGIEGLHFPTIQIGARAHIQHLVAYASDRLPRIPLVDPRFFFVKRGSARYVSELSNKWAADTDYGSKIMKHALSLWSAYANGWIIPSSF